MATEETAVEGQGTERDWHTQFDLNDPSFGNKFDEISDDLLATCPVARTVDGEYVINRHADVSKVLQDWETFSSARGIRGAAYQPPDDELLRPNEVDPPDHGWLRGSWNRHFTPTAVAEHEPEVQAIINGLIDDFVADGHVEAVSQFADPLSCATFCMSVAHMPAEDVPYLQKTFQSALAGGSIEERGENWGNAQRYMLKFLEQRKDEPRRDDVVDTILHFEFPDGREYPIGKRAAGLTQVTAAGLVTTGAIVSGALYHLATNREDRERLKGDPELMKRAIEEFLRVFAAAPMIGRYVEREADLSGQHLEPGDYVWYNLGAANRDPEVFEDPETLNIDRFPNKHMSFAQGTHRCLGVHFARLNIRTALNSFLTRIPEFELADGFDPDFQGGMTRRMTALELTFDASKAS